MGRRTQTQYESFFLSRFRTHNLVLGRADVFQVQAHSCALTQDKLFLVPLHKIGSFFCPNTRQARSCALTQEKLVLGGADVFQVSPFLKRGLF